MPIQIRPATLNDYTAVNAIVKEGQDEHAAALPHIFRSIETVMPREYYDSLITGDNTCLFVAESEPDGRIAGFAIIELGEAPPFDSLVPRKYAYINDFGVGAAYQRLGIGRMLFDACLTWGRSHGATSLDLTVWEFNQKAIRFYESLGMESVSRKMNVPL